MSGSTTTSWVTLVLLMWTPLVRTLGAQEPEPPGQPVVEISGFGDVLYVNHGGQFQTGQVEVDLETTLDRGLDVCVAMALDGDRFGLGTFTMELPLANTHGMKAGLLAGQFDVPFGLDWRVYPSVDRRLISGPLVVAGTHDSWNDCGVQGYLETPHTSTVVYAVNGFAYQREGTPVDMRFCAGGRQGVRPFADLEIGGSCALFFAPGKDLDMMLLGVDGEFTHGPLALKGEYLAQRTQLAGPVTVTHMGFYIQGSMDLGRCLLISRYGQFRPHAQKYQGRTSLGVGWLVQEGCEIRVEEQLNSTTKNPTFVQMVVGF